MGAPGAGAPMKFLSGTHKKSYFALKYFYVQIDLLYYILIAIVERRYREISRVHCRVLLRVRSTSNNAKGNERVVFPRYRRSTMAIRYLSYI